MKTRKDSTGDCCSPPHCSRLFLIRGVPGSGKTTYAKTLGITDHYEADIWFENNGGYDPARIKLAHEWRQKRHRCYAGWPRCCGEVYWKSSSGSHSLDVDTDNPDPVLSVFNELKANCIIRDCLKPNVQVANQIHKMKTRKQWRDFYTEVLAQYKDVGHIPMCHVPIFKAAYEDAKLRACIVAHAADVGLSDKLNYRIEPTYTLFINFSKQLRLDFLNRAIEHFRDRRFKAKITNQKPETKKHDHEHEQNSKGNDAFDG